MIADSDDIKQKIDSMIDNLNIAKLCKDYENAKKIFCESGLKITKPVRKLKSFFRDPVFFLDAPQELQFFLYGSGSRNASSLKFYFVATLLDIPISKFKNASDPNSEAEQLVDNVSEALRKKGFIVLATMKDVEKLAERIDPMLDKLTNKVFTDAYKSAANHYLGNTKTGLGTQGYSFFKDPKKLTGLINTTELKNQFTYGVSQSNRFHKAESREPSKSPETSPAQDLQNLLCGSGHNNALSLKGELVAYLLKYALTNNENELAAEMVNRVSQKLYDRGITPKIPQSAETEMKSIEHSSQSYEESLQAYKNLIDNYALQLSATMFSSDNNNDSGTKSDDENQDTSQLSTEASYRHFLERYCDDGFELANNSTRASNNNNNSNSLTEPDKENNSKTLVVKRV